jgi:hypothetical protein
MWDLCILMAMALLFVVISSDKAATCNSLSGQFTMYIDLKPLHMGRHGSNNTAIQNKLLDFSETKCI